MYSLISLFREAEELAEVEAKLVSYLVSCLMSIFHGVLSFKSSLNRTLTGKSAMLGQRLDPRLYFLSFPCFNLWETTDLRARITVFGDSVSENFLWLHVTGLSEIVIPMIISIY